MVYDDPMFSEKMLFRVSAVGLALCSVALLLLTAASPADFPLWEGVGKHIPNLTILAWAAAGLFAFCAYLARARLSNSAKWSVLILTICVASFPTRWLLIAVFGLGEWLPPFGSYLWRVMVHPVIAELIIGIMVALLGAFAVSWSRPN
jgi:hypothetical protein